MEMSDPQELLNMIDQNILKDYLGYQPFQIEPLESSQVVHYSEPYGIDTEGVPTEVSNQSTGTEVATTPSANETVTQKQFIKGKVLRLGDFIDTDAVRCIRFHLRKHHDPHPRTLLSSHYHPLTSTPRSPPLNSSPPTQQTLNLAHTAWNTSCPPSAPS
jgi:hypothetical protein